MNTTFDIYVLIKINIQFEENNFILFFVSDRRYYSYWYSNLYFSNGHGPSKCKYIPEFWGSTESDIWGYTGSDVWKYNFTTYYLFSLCRSCRNNDEVSVYFLITNRKDIIHVSNLLIYPCQMILDSHCKSNFFFFNSEIFMRIKFIQRWSTIQPLKSNHCTQRGMPDFSVTWWR